jgi:hypothetical protein
MMLQSFLFLCTAPNSGKEALLAKSLSFLGWKGFRANLLNFFCKVGFSSCCLGSELIFRSSKAEGLVGTGERGEVGEAADAGEEGEEGDEGVVVGVVGVVVGVDGEEGVEEEGVVSMIRGGEEGACRSSEDVLLESMALLEDPLLSEWGEAVVRITGAESLAARAVLSPSLIELVNNVAITLYKCLLCTNSSPGLCTPRA